MASGKVRNKIRYRSKFSWSLIRQGKTVQAKSSHLPESTLFGVCHVVTDRVLCSVDVARAAFPLDTKAAGIHKITNRALSTRAVLGLRRCDHLCTIVVSQVAAWIRAEVQAATSALWSTTNGTSVTVTISSIHMYWSSSSLLLLLSSSSSLLYIQKWQQSRLPFLNLVTWTWSASFCPT